MIPGLPIVPAISPTLAAWAVGPVQFDRPLWLVLIPILGVATWLMGRRSLAGLGGATRTLAMAARFLVIGLLVGALAEPQLRRVSPDVAVTVVLDASRSIPPEEQRAVASFIQSARSRNPRTEDRLGVVTTAREAFVQTLPSANVTEIDRTYLGQTDATNLAAGVRMAIAASPENAANRLLLVSDGNETEGSLLAAAEAALAADIPIDVLPVEYAYPSEVVVERVVAPPNARGGETINLNVVVTATSPALGRLTLTANGEPIDLDPDEPGFGAVRELARGTNYLAVPIEPRVPGPQSYSAQFEPLAALAEDGTPLASGQTGDSITQNNQAEAVTFVGSEGWVLVVAENPEEYSALEAALLESRLRTLRIDPGAFPTELIALNAYDAIVLVNQPAHNFTDAQADNIRQYVADMGGGLVMIGGPESLGAGGWIGSPLEDALPVKLDPPQKRQMPRGALALVIHSVEIPRGVYWGKEICNVAVDALSRLDLVGIIEFQGLAGTDWVYPLSEKGDATAVKRAINTLQFGDMPSFDPSLQLALNGLTAASAGQKHCIVISDGDPSLNRRLLSDFRDAGITISAVGVATHGGGDSTMQLMANETGGEYYFIANEAQLPTLPEIIIKEAQTVKRTLIWEGEPFAPTLLGLPTETLRGVSAIPPITGYVVTAEREGLALVTIRAERSEVREGQTEAISDPIAAQWQYELGRVVVFTSDASSRWATAWTGWEGYRQFWEQHVRWAMRPTGSANLRVTTQSRGSTTEVTIEALDNQGERLNFADFRARASTPDGRGRDIGVTQIGPGRYRGTFETDDPGSYVVSMTYRAPGLQPGAPAVEGSVQAAVTRPFADEFRALESNLGVLRAVADRTGGRVLERTGLGADLWSREGLEPPVALRPIWLAVAMAAIALFIADVGIRRVRLDPRQVAAGAAALLRRAEKRPADADRGRALIAARQKAANRFGDDDTRRQAAELASRKFEARAGAAPEANAPIALSGQPESGAPAGLNRPDPASAARDAQAKGEKAGMSRLMQAKQRARDELKDQDRP